MLGYNSHRAHGERRGSVPPRRWPFVLRFPFSLAAVGGGRSRRGMGRFGGSGSRGRRSPAMVARNAAARLSSAAGSGLPSIPDEVWERIKGYGPRELAIFSD